MIPDWQRALQKATNRLAAGGELHIVDFGPCSGLPDVSKTLLYAWLKRFHVSPRTTLFATVEQLASSQHKTFLNSLSHCGYAQHVVLQSE
jgi:S-adenosylmethionine-diacylgycerolhomoserine-N-methlytransferase